MINRYLYQHFLFGFLIISLILNLIGIIFGIVVGSPRLLAEGWSVGEVIMRALLQAPSFYAATFPAAAAIGTLLGLSYLAQKSELVVLQSASISRIRIMWCVAKFAVVLGAFGFLLIAYIAPISNHWADDLHHYAGGVDQNFWLKDHNDYVFVQQADSHGLYGVDLFKLGKHGIDAVYHADSAKFNQGWVLQSVTITHYAKIQQITQSVKKTMIARELMAPGLLDNILLTPDKLPLNELMDFVQYRAQNHLTNNSYQLQLGKIIVLPFATLLMTILIVPFVFGQQRSSQFLINMLLGVVISFVFYFLNQIFTPLAVIYHWPIWLGVSAPSMVMVVLLTAVLIFKRQG